MTLDPRDDAPPELMHPSWCAPDACTADRCGSGSHLSRTRWLRAEPPNPQQVAVTLVQGEALDGQYPVSAFVDLAFYDDDGDVVSAAVDMGVARAVAQLLLSWP